MTEHERAQKVLVGHLLGYPQAVDGVLEIFLISDNKNSR